jgi:hypothetical protein
MHASKRGHASGGDSQLRCGFWRCDCKALQGKQADDHLQTVAEPVLELLRHQILLLRQSAELTQQFLFASMGRQQLDFSSLIAARLRPRRKHTLVAQPKRFVGCQV